MQRIWLSLLLLTALALGACTQATPAATETPTAEAATAVATGAPAGPATCSVVSLAPNPTIVALFPPVAEDDWITGSFDAPVTFLEYSEVQCPYCAQLEPLLVKLQKEYPQDVRLVYRHFPLTTIHDKAMLGAQAIEAAGKQERQKFFELKNIIFEEQPNWNQKTPAEFETWLKEQAEKIGLDVARFASDLTDDEIVKKVQASFDDAMRIGLPGTPFLLVNGTPYQQAMTYANLEGIMKLMKMQDRLYTSCPPVTIDPARQYSATVKTERGDFTVKLFAAQAPIAVNSFIFLARNGWFDNVTFHRVLSGFVAQSGDPSGSGMGFPGYAFGNEISPDLKFDRPGLVAMANAGPDSNGSQFFITYDALPQLDEKYTIFGEVTSGLEIVEGLTPRDPDAGGDLPPGDKILSITIEEQ